MSDYRLIKRTNSYGDSWYLVQEKGLLWGWNTVSMPAGRAGDSPSLEVHFTEEEARAYIKRATRHNVVTSEIVEV